MNQEQSLRAAFYALEEGNAKSAVVEFKKLDAEQMHIAFRRVMDELLSITIDQKAKDLLVVLAFIGDLSLQRGKK